MGRKFNPKRQSRAMRAALAGLDRDPYFMAAATSRAAKAVRALNDDELNSLQALICLAAVSNGIGEQVVADRLEAMFDVARAEEIEAARYDAAVAFLINFDSRVN
ncbi:MAG: hypothetical protein GC131_08210 [Alphaproteobacteria bacterium]|nr:hypothetical protein [Alphaproteobacteria bacterium]